MRQSLTFLFLLSFIALSHGQDTKEEIIENVYRLLSNTNSYDGVPYYALNTRTTKVIGGSEFLEENWKEGLVVTHQDSLYRIIGRYDTHNDEVQILLDGNLKSLSPGAVKGVAINDRIFITLPYIYEKQKEVGYFELLVEGKFPLLSHYYATTQNATNHPLIGNVNGEVKIVVKEQLYYGTPNGTAVKLSKSRKDFLKVFGNKSKQIERYAKEHNLSTKKKEEVMQIFGYYNSKIVQ